MITAQFADTDCKQQSLIQKATLAQVDTQIKPLTWQEYNEPAQCPAPSWLVYSSIGHERCTGIAEVKVLNTIQDLWNDLWYNAIKF